MAKTKTETTAGTTAGIDTGAGGETGGALTEKVQGGEIELYEAGEDAGAGMENITIEEQRIPILRVLDPKSPQTKPASQGGIGARGGDIFNTSTNQIYNGERGLYIIAAYRDQKYVNYIKRDEDGGGGGFVGMHEPEDPIVKRRQAERLQAEGNLFGKLANGQNDDGKDMELVQTFYLYCICIVPNDDGSLPPLEQAEIFRALVPFASTQIKKYQSFIERNSNITYIGTKADGSTGAIKPPLWAHMWRINTRYESKNAFNWYGWNISLSAKKADGSEEAPIKSRLSLKDPLYVMAKDFYQLVRAGEAKVDFAKQATDGQEATNTTEQQAVSGTLGHSSEYSDSIPFGNS